jgi:hypothetical protein
MPRQGNHVNSPDEKRQRRLTPVQARSATLIDCLGHDRFEGELMNCYGAAVSQILEREKSPVM